MKFPFKQRWQPLLFLTSFLIAVILTSCNTVIIDRYEATAVTTLTWRVNYLDSPAEDKRGRFESFASASLVNRNGQKPEEGVIGPDDKGLWWAKLPPKPSIDQIEQRQKPYEKAGRAELLRTVEYYIIYDKNGQTLTQPTNYQVYRQVARAYSEGKSLELTLGLFNNSVQKARPVGG